MELKEFDILLDIKKGYTKTDIEVVQQDIDSNVFNINIINGAYPYDLYETAAEIIFKKSDGKIVQQTNIEMVNAVQGKIRCKLSVNTIAVAGKVEADVRISKAGTLLTTQRFSFMVKKALLRNCDVESTSEFPILNQLIGEVNDLIDIVDGIEQQVPDNVVKAIGKLADDVNVLSNNLPNIGYTNEGIKNSIYRGKNLGSAVTAKQYADIANGSFTDLYIGDYWTINGINWRIAAFNYYRSAGDSLVPGNHITLVSDTALYSHIMNDTTITTGGYIGSKMYTESLEQAKTTIRGIFGTHLLKHRRILSNVTADGKASGWAWMDSEVELMNEIMVYGSIVWGESTFGSSGYNIGVDKSQLPLFALNPRMINTGQSYWLRDVVSATAFASVGGNGIANRYDASIATGVRPAFSIS